MPETTRIPVDLIDPSPFQHRAAISESLVRNLMDSIQAVGLLHPILVRPRPSGRYELLAGHHRLEAVRRLGWETVPAMVREASDLEAQAITLQENLARENPNPVDVARAVMRDLEAATGLPADQVRSVLVRLHKGGKVEESVKAKVVGVLQGYGIKPSSFYSHYRHILNLPVPVVEAVLALDPEGFRSLSRLQALARYLEDWEARLALEMTRERIPVPEGASLLELPFLVSEAFVRSLREDPLTPEELRNVVGMKIRNPMMMPLKELREAPESVDRATFLDLLTLELVRYHRVASGRVDVSLPQVSVSDEIYDLYDGLEEPVYEQDRWRTRLWAGLVTVPLAQGKLAKREERERFRQIIQTALAEEREALKGLFERVVRELRDQGLLEEPYVGLLERAVGYRLRNLVEGFPFVWLHNESTYFAGLMEDMGVPKPVVARWKEWWAQATKRLERVRRKRIENRLRMEPPEERSGKEMSGS